MSQKIPGIPGVPPIEELLNECTENTKTTEDDDQKEDSAFQKEDHVNQEAVEKVEERKYETPGNIPPINLN